MKVDFKLNENQALKIANTFYNSNFGCYGRGNFDLTRKEFARVLMILFNSSKPNIDTEREFERLLARMY